MKLELDDEAIKKSKGKIDKIVLITALELFANHRFLKERISEIKIEEAYDSAGHVKPEIVIRNSEGPVKTTASLRDLLSSYLNHLKAGNLAEPHAFLFPGYAGEKGQKRLRRHIQSYTEYRDFNDLKRAVRKGIDDQLAESGIGAGERVNQIAATTGISHRTAEQSVRPHNYRGQKKPRNETPEPIEDRYNILKQWDEIAVLPELVMLDEFAVRENISDAFDLLLGISEHGPMSLTQLSIKNDFVCTLKRRIHQIETELIEESNAVEDFKARKHLTFRELIEEALKEKPRTLEGSIDIMTANQSLPAGFGSGEANLSPPRQTVKQMKDVKPEITTAIINANIDSLLVDIRRVRRLVPNTKWQKLIADEASTRKTISPSKPKRKKKEPSITFPRDTEATIKRKKISGFRERELQVARDNLIVVLENARELIKYTGLYVHEVPYLRIQDVIKSQHHQFLVETNIHQDWITDEIQPISDKYPRGCNKKAVHLTREAKEIVLRQIEFLKNIGPQHLIIERHLFPLNFKTQYTNRMNEAELIRRGQKPKPTKPVKIKPKESQRLRFGRLLRQVVALGQRFDYHLKYEHLREYGIRIYCSKLRDQGEEFEDVIRSVCTFARYESEKDAERIWEEVMKYDPDQYETIYESAVKSGDRLRALLNEGSVGDLVEIEWPKFISAINILSNNHKNVFLREYKDVLNYNIPAPI